RATLGPRRLRCTTAPLALLGPYRWLAFWLERKKRGNSLHVITTQGKYFAHFIGIVSIVLINTYASWTIQPSMRAGLCRISVEEAARCAQPVGNPPRSRRRACQNFGFDRSAVAVS